MKQFPAAIDVCPRHSTDTNMNTHNTLHCLYKKTGHPESELWGSKQILMFIHLAMIKW